MCGIIGYKGYRNSNLVSLEALKSLEYRGYDSWGIANKTENTINVFKQTGKIGEIKEIPLPESDIAIGHTRWATHGAVTKENSHPHLSAGDSIAVVHNGIIENFQELREFLSKKGISFKSQTDTEVIPNLIEDFIVQGEDFREAFRQALLKLEGSFAVVAMHKDYDFLLFARKDSPLVIGIGKDENFIASDIPAFLNYTNKVIYLENNEYGVLDEEVKVFTIDKNMPVTRKETEINWTVEQAKKGNFPHFMLKEITDQKLTVKKAVEQDSELIKKAIKMMKDAVGIFFVGCGTSYHACVSAAYVFSHVAKIHVNVVLASEFRNYEEFLTGSTLVVALSQSGETADLLDAIKAAKQHGCRTVSVVNVMGSTLTRLCDVNIMMNAGPEICVLSTKSYTSQLTILMLLAYSVAGRQEEAKGLIKKVCASVDKIIDVNLDKLKGLAERIKASHDFLFMISSRRWTALAERALKESMQHGPFVSPIYEQYFIKK